jgi:hypothetical protein
VASIRAARAARCARGRCRRGHDADTAGAVGTGGLILTVVGFAILAAGGTIGGSITYVHGMRVLNLVDEPALEAMVPSVVPEKEEAAKG